MDWDNLRFFLELARSGTLTATGRRMGVDHTTVARRVQALERQVAATLFTREPDGHRLTEAGQSLMASAQTMERAVQDIARSEGLTNDGLNGVVRLGATEGFGAFVLASQLSRLAYRYPRLTIDLLALPRLVHLSRREADIVISLERPKIDTAVTTRLTDYTLYLYGQADYLATHPPISRLADLPQHGFINYVDDLLFTKELQFLGDLLRQPVRFVLRSTSISAQLQAVCAGAGLAVLPAFMATREPSLVRVLPDQARFLRTFWMSMPNEVRHQPAIQVVWNFVRAAVADLQKQLLQ